LSTTLIFNPATKLFSNPRVPLENVQTGQYQIVVQMPHYLKQQLENSLDKTKIISFESTSSALFSSVKLIPGDISPLPNGDNIIDVKDYQALVNCYGSKANTPSCLNKDAPDLNDDGVIDGIDYNIFLFGLRIYLIQNNLLP